ncbi:MAG: DUF4012 domain-containing protein [Candidatus Uhrbacteria bacterium]|nr:DUF4012 domain-containing protein [Candidatus Uhrbacteria bacterium]
MPYLNEMSLPSPDFLTCPIQPQLPAPTVPPPRLLLPPRRYVRRSRFVIAALFFIGVFGPLVFGGVWAGWSAFHLRLMLQSVKEHVAVGEILEAQGKLYEANIQAQEIQRGLRLTAFWREAPWIGKRLRVLEQAAQAGQATIQGFQDLTAVAASVQQAFVSVKKDGPLFETGVSSTRSFHDLSPDDKRALLGRLSQTLSQLRVARDKLAIALQALERVKQEESWLPFRSVLSSNMQALSTLKRQIDEGAALAEVFLPLLNSAQEKTYLVVLQNADELRPTGGFIGTIGTVRVASGDIQHIKFEDVYAVDGPVQETWKDIPPEPLAKGLGVKAWFLRDSNWSPDFPQTAERLMDVYLRERAMDSRFTIHDLRFDGVIAFEPRFFADLLRLTGPITVEGKTFTADNFFTQLQYDVEIGFRADGTPTAQRKEIVGKVGDVLLDNLFHQPSSRWPALLEIMTNALERKDLLVYVRDPKILALLDAHGWSGRTRESPTDYLWVVDTNVAAFKTDGVMEKRLAYTLDASSPTTTLSTVTLTYRNTNRVINWRYTRYRDYVRVYVPEGSELLSVEGAMEDDITKTGWQVKPGRVDVMRDLGKTVFGTFWSVEPGETRQLKFTYRLPLAGDRLQVTGYRLLVQKQPGARMGLTLDLMFGKKVVQATPGEDPKEFGDTRYRVSLPLEKDQEFNIRL